MWAKQLIFLYRQLKKKLKGGLKLQITERIFKNVFFSLVEFVVDAAFMVK